jgi:16S rRNA (adenine1518-N6/adenine1519-N6)-dimethyltransferase
MKNPREHAPVEGAPPAPKKSFGQHFLTDVRAARRIAELATTPPGGTVLEIGAGRGALTVHLLERASKVIAIERDRELLPVLQRTFAAAIAEGRLELLEADAAAVDWGGALAGQTGPVTIAGNVPYSITGKLIQLAVEAAPRVEGVVFLIQKEVADRLIAPPDGDHYGALSVFTQAAFAIERPLVLRAGAFFPPPKVDSAVVRLLPRRPPRAAETEAFREAVKRAFLARRKTLRNAWKGIYGWSREQLEAHAAAAGINLDARGETLAVEAFDALSRRLEIAPPAPPSG